MSRIISAPTILAALLALGLSAAPAQALFSRTYVSAAKGDDANDCSTKPCRTFKRAHDQTSPDGEVTVLHPGGYGGLTITKSISLVNDGGGEASILVSGGGTGIIVNAPAAAYVNLRGLTIQGIGFGGGTGIVFNTGFALTIENCVVRNHTGDGIAFLPVSNSSLSVSNTLVADNGNIGIRVAPTGSGSAKAVLKRVQAYNNSADGVVVDGFFATGAIKATAADSVAANNGASGFIVRAGSSASSSLMVVRSVAANNGFGLFANGANATLRVGQSTVTGSTSKSWSTVWRAGFCRATGTITSTAMPTAIPARSSSPTNSSCPMPIRTNPEGLP